MNWLKKIWRWLFGGKKPEIVPAAPAVTPPAAGIIMEVPVPVMKKIKPAPTVFLADVKKCDPTPNPNKYWKRFKRGKRIS